MENNRSSWGSNLGFLMAAIGSAVGLGNIWGFPYKMGKSGGFTFLLVYLLLAIFVGMIIMVSELAVGRQTKLSPIDAYKQVSKKFAWIGWLATIAPFLIMSFYTVLGGYCLQYIALNMTKLSFGNSSVPLSGGEAFGAMLTTPFGCVVFTILFIIICMLIVQGGVNSGIEKFNNIGMPALFVMLLIIIVRALTLPHAVEGLKFMFVPGYAVKAGFIDSAPNLIEVLGTAGGQMFFSLSLAMGAILTYGSYLSKDENLVKNSVIIVASDTLIALMAGIAVIPAAVANGIANGTPVGQIKLSGPNLLFVTLQDVFSNMGSVGPLFGVIFYVLVLIAAISSAISLMETIAAHWIDKDLAKGENDTRQRNVLVVSLLILLEAVIVAADGLGSNFSPASLLGISTVPTFLDCFLDFMDCWSEGIAMPLGAMLMALMIGWEMTPDLVLDEVAHGDPSNGFKSFYKICIRFVVPIVMAFVLAGQMIGFFGGSETLWYVVAFLALVVFWIFAAMGKKKEA
ncbi:MAG: sodium-dependent transporter [Oscillospiraceae bacterium]|nr:sodium-dependent transporter [Oscillospiraceae bacterium]